MTALRRLGDLRTPLAELGELVEDRASDTAVAERYYAVFVTTVGKLLSTVRPGLSEATVIQRSTELASALQARFPSIDTATRQRVGEVARNLATWERLDEFISGSIPAANIAALPPSRLRNARIAAREAAGNRSSASMIASEVPTADNETAPGAPCPTCSRPKTAPPIHTYSHWGATNENIDICDCDAARAGSTAASGPGPAPVAASAQGQVGPRKISRSERDARDTPSDIRAETVAAAAPAIHDEYGELF